MKGHFDKFLETKELRVINSWEITLKGILREKIPTCNRVKEKQPFLNTPREFFIMKAAF